MNYDLIIIGAGPAALTASVYASRYKINHAIIGENPGGYMNDAHKVCNFPSEVEISGFDLAMKMKAQAEKLGAKISLKKVTEINKIENGFSVKTSDDQEITSRSVLLATGTIRRQLGLPNEGKFVGHGLSYCATCDAMFFRDKITTVIGSGNSALTAALYLAELCPKVYVIIRSSEFKGEPAWIESVKNNAKIEIIPETNILELVGEGKLEALKLDKAYKGEELLKTDGLFVEVGSTPATSFFDGLSLKFDPQGYIDVKPDQTTSVAGVYAAGDITNGSNKFHQIITACAEGAVAASSVFQYLKS
jgi:thioredoxin reductase (NADPH)